MNTHDIELPPLPTPDFPGVVIKGMKAIPRYLFTGNQMAEYGQQCATAAIEADRKRIATALESRFIVADSKANVSHPDYQYFVGAADAYDIAEQIVKGELDE